MTNSDEIIELLKSIDQRLQHVEASVLDIDRITSLLEELIGELKDR